MRLKKFLDINSNEDRRIGFDHIDSTFSDGEFYQEEFPETHPRGTEKEFPEEDDIVPDEEDSDEINNDDVVESLLSTLRKMIKNAKFNKSFVSTDEEGCINIQFVLNKTEKMSGVMKVMNLLKKLESDILIQYESEFDLWETKDGDPLITGKFFYDEGVSSDNEEEPPF